MDTSRTTPATEHAAQLHRSTPKADPVEAIRTAIRASPWLTIAIALHVVLGAIFAVMYMSHEAKKEETNVIAISAAQRKVEEPPPVEETPPEVFDRTAIPENQEAELVSTEDAHVTLPESLVDPNQDLHLEVGDPNPINALPGTTGGTAIGVGTGGHTGTGVPSPFGGRIKGGGGGGPGKGRVPTGPTQATQEAVQRGLVWLARHQERTGQWSAATFMNLCPPGKPCQPETALEPGIYSHQVDVGLTGLALLCYLGAGFGHDAKQYIVDTVNGRKIYIGKDIVKPGLQWLVDRQQEDGSFSSGGNYFLYNEALAALALSEAYGLTQNRYWKEPAQRAINFLCKAQKPDPTAPAKKWGWRYVPAEGVQAGAPVSREQADSDTSVTGWMVMALKSAQLCGLEVPQASIDGALEFTKWCTAGGNKKGLVGYVSPDTAGDPVLGDHENFVYHVGTMSSIGMCIRIFLTHDEADPFLFEAADVLLKDLPAKGTDPDPHPPIDYYYWYYGSLALNQIDGPDAPKRTNKYWGPWNKAMQDTLIELQDQKVGECTLGGWMRPDRWSYGVGPIYTTAINVLTLEVYYRYPNAFGSAKGKPASASKAADAKAPAPAGGGTDGK